MSLNSGKELELTEGDIGHVTKKHLFSLASTYGQQKTQNSNTMEICLGLSETPHRCCRLLKLGELHH